MKFLCCLLLLIPLSLTAQVTLIPDTRFELYLVNEGIDTDGIVNGQVLTSDIADETILNIEEFGIEDLTGIEDFASLEFLDLFRMNISQIDISQNTNLRRLKLDDLPLESLDVSNNSNLTNLNISLDRTSGLYTSPLSSLDVSSNLLLERIGIYGTVISEIDVSINSNLVQFELHLMQELTRVYLKNGANEQISFLRIIDNPNLQCVEVDDPASVIAGTAPPYNNWIISGNPIITDDCSLGVEEYLRSQISISPNPVKFHITINATNRLEIENIGLFDIQGRLVMTPNSFSLIDLSGLKQGIYLVAIETNKGVLTLKVIKN
ncbi:MAG: T9SS type A sorting domain-containing protein [Flavobacteriaceae bacterium]